MWNANMSEREFECGKDVYKCACSVCVKSVWFKECLCVDRLCGFCVCMHAEECVCAHFLGVIKSESGFMDAIFSSEFLKWIC